MKYQCVTPRFPTEPPARNAIAAQSGRGDAAAKKEKSKAAQPGAPRVGSLDHIDEGTRPSTVKQESWPSLGTGPAIFLLEKSRGARIPDGREGKVTWHVTLSTGHVINLTTDQLLSHRKFARRVEDMTGLALAPLSRDNWYIELNRAMAPLRQLSCPPCLREEDAE